MITRALAAHAVLVAVALASGGAAAQETCEHAISPSLAEAVFEQLRGPAGADGCALAGVSTGQWRMEVRWERAGSALSPAWIEPVACARAPRAAGPTLASTAPEDLVRACPDAVTRLDAAVRATAAPAEMMASTRGPWPRSAAVVAWVAIALALLGTAAVSLLVLRRGAP